MKETYTADGFTLARWTSADGPELAAAVAGSLEHLGAWLIWAAGGYSADDAEEFLRRTAKHWESGEAHDFAIRVGDAVAGGIGVMAREGGVEIGYWLSRDFTGRGLMTRAAALLTAEAFRLGAGYVEIKHDELNVRSGAVPERLGFVKVREEQAEKPLAPACGGTDHVWRKEKP
ncbi:GNAT family N-acetyltransferase [Amycolatopsis mongoliensis]|uniref:GNAT family N-acetyltransferase n=1 Tax=Amycolatopsis mongoliensis TaxID=715475 RepID=A0A9Y2JH53_9PSEU|nr:GNAT family N-acetyltransferase [Amycolatopsis sp. 4-36]WIX97967.1 GNAT family N-acetyltransferase [Amycolatopsis sp. 4-36]